MGTSDGRGSYRVEKTFGAPWQVRAVYSQGAEKD